MKDSYKTECMVSVICLCYNHAKYLRRCLDGIVTQDTSFPFKVYVHDDASTDGSQEIIRDYAKRYSFIVPLLEETNQYSQGIKITSTYIMPLIDTPYMANCECDDYWVDHEKLQKQVDFLESHSDYSVCGHSFETVDEEGNHLLFDGRFGMGNHSISVPEVIMNDRLPQFATLVYRSSVRASQPQFFNKSMVGDYPLMLNLAANGKFFYIGELMSCYRRHGDGSWVSNMNKNPEKFLTHCLKLNEVLEEYNEYTENKYEDTIDLREAQINLMASERNAKLTGVFHNRYFRELPFSLKVKWFAKVILRKFGIFRRNLY